VLPTWLSGTPTTNIYYSVGNVSIGSNTVLNSSALTIKGDVSLFPLTDTQTTLPTIIASTPAFTVFTPVNTLYRCVIFTYVAGGYSITIPSGGLIADVLMVGAGGCGYAGKMGGGGSGSVLYGQNIFIPEGVYSLYVANTTFPINSTFPQRGENTTGFGATILGGGSSFDIISYGGGSSAGGSSLTQNNVQTNLQPKEVNQSTKGEILDSATLYNGNLGGIGVPVVTAVNVGQGAGGGGVGSVGGDGTIGTTATGN
jgi:hypothetical protein